MNKTNSSSGMRKVPRQRRSQQMVAKIVSAAEELIQADGPGAVTTNRVAELAV